MIERPPNSPIPLKSKPMFSLFSTKTAFDCCLFRDSISTGTGWCVPKTWYAPHRWKSWANDGALSNLRPKTSVGYEFRPGPTVLPRLIFQLNPQRLGTLAGVILSQPRSRRQFRYVSDEEQATHFIDVSMMIRVERDSKMKVGLNTDLGPTCRL